MLSLERLGRSSKIVILLIVQLIPYREEEVRFLLGFRGRGSRTDHGLNLPKRTMNNSLLGQRTLGSLLLNRSMIHPTSKSTYTVLCKTALTLCASDDLVRPLSSQGTPCDMQPIIEYPDLLALN
jgi:hypothetical protein